MGGGAYYRRRQGKTEDIAKFQTEPTMAPATPASHQAWLDVVEADYFMHCRLPAHALLLAGISFLGSMNNARLLACFFVAIQFRRKQPHAVGPVA